MIAPAELARIVEEAERGQDETAYAITLGDGEPLLAIAETLTTFSAMQSGVDAESADHATVARLAEWLESELANCDLVADPDAVARLFRPFLNARDLDAFLDDPGFENSSRASRDVQTAETYAEAVTATFGPSARSIAQAVAPDARAVDGLAQEIVAVCGAASLPIALTTFPLDGARAYRVLAAFGLALEQLRTRIAGRALAMVPAMRHLSAELDRLLRRKLTQVQILDAERDGAAPLEDRRPDRFAALEYVGALLELRAISVELADQLAHTYASRHRYTSKANEWGIGEPTVVDQRPSLKKMQALQPKVDEWITEALTLAGRDPTNATLEHKVDRIAVTLGAIETRLAILRVTEYLMDHDDGPRLWEQIESWANNIEEMFVPLEADVDYENVKVIVIEQSKEAALLVQSYKWSRIVFQAALDATEVILAIESGSRMGGVGPRLQTAMAGAGARTVTRAIGTAEIERLLAGSTVVAMAKAADPQKGRRKGIKAEKGLGLSPSRPRDEILSITGTATRRFVDRMVFKTFWEVKNVLNLRLTRQLTDFMLYAQATGMKMVLYIRPAVKGAAKAGTKLSPSLRDAIKILKREGLIEIRYLKIY